MSIEEIIEGYGARLSKDKGLDVIINDRYGLIKKSQTNNFNGIINGWHNHPYCMRIKSNRRLWERCVFLKRFRDKKLIENPIPSWHICYCGVAEYVIPVVFNGLLISEISVTGFKGGLSQKMTDILVRRTNSAGEDFSKDYDRLLEITDSLSQMLNEYLLPIKELILKVASEGRQSNTFFGGEGKTTGGYVTKALDFINNNFTKPITATDVAKHCSLSLSHLQHLFGKYHIRGVFAEILYKRIEMACYMLKNTDCSVKQIALTCGFNNVDYFSTAFKKQCGTTPLKYKKR